MPTGVVVDASKLESKGFGFIKPDGGGDNLFFHIAGAGNASVQALVKGQAVSYTEGRNNKGVCAENIVSAAASGGGGVGGGFGLNSGSAASAFGAGASGNAAAAPVAFGGGGGASVFGGGVSAFGGGPQTAAAASFGSTVSAFGSSSAFGGVAGAGGGGSLFGGGAASAFGSTVRAGGSTACKSESQNTSFTRMHPQVSAFGSGAQAAAPAAVSFGSTVSAFGGAGGSAFGGGGSVFSGGGGGFGGGAGNAGLPATQDETKPVFADKVWTKQAGRQEEGAGVERGSFGLDGGKPRSSGLAARLGVSPPKTGGGGGIQEGSGAVDVSASRVSPVASPLVPALESKAAKAVETSSGTGAIVCPLTQVNLRGMTVAKLSKRLLDSPAINAEQIANALKNRFGVVSKHSNKQLLAHEYARTACGVARKQLAGQQGGVGAGVAQIDKKGRVAFLKVRGVETEEEVRRLMVAQMGGQGLGVVEYVSQMAAGTHVVKCFDGTAATSVVGYSAGGVSLTTLDAKELKIYARKMTVDAKRALGGPADGVGDFGQGVKVGEVGWQGGNRGAGEGVDLAGGFDGMENADAEQGVCEECGAEGTGAIDMSNNSFYCDSCWASFQPDVEGMEGEGDAGEAHEQEEEGSSLSCESRAGEAASKFSVPGTPALQTPAAKPPTAKPPLAKPAVPALLSLSREGGCDEGEDDGEPDEDDAYKIISGDPNAPRQQTMCSESELKFRQNSGEGAFSEMEREATTKEVKWPELVVCRYQFHRGGAGAAHSGEEMRTLRTMQNTITHLETVWMSEEMLARAPGGYAGIYKVLHDALKAISADMAFLRRHYAPSLVVANVFERMIRIALDAHYRVAEDLSVELARPAPWTEEWVQQHGIPNQMRKKEGIGMSRAAQGGTALGSHEDYIYKNLNTLVKDVYPELRSRGITSPAEAEFVCYFIVKLAMRSGHQKDEQDVYHSLPDNIRSSPEVQAAMGLRQAIEMDNYAAFFKNIADILENSATFSFRHFGYLLCALAHEYFPKMRLRALEILTNCRGSKNAFSESLRSLYPLLGLDDEEHCASFLEARNVVAKDGLVLLVKGVPIADTLELCDVRKVKLISAKMPAVPGHVCGAATTVSGLVGAARRVRAQAMARKQELDAASLAADTQARKRAEEDRLQRELEETRMAEKQSALRIQEEERRQREVLEREQKEAKAREEEQERERQQRAAEAARKEQEAREAAERRQREERERREKETKGIALLETAQTKLSACTLNFQEAREGHPEKLRQTLQLKKADLETVAASLAEARPLLGAATGHSRLVTVEQMLASEETRVKEAEALLVRLAVEAQGKVLMTRYSTHLAAAQECQLKCGETSATLLADKSALVAKALDPNVLAVESVDYTDGLARKLKDTWQASEELHAQLQSHIGEADEVLVQVAALDEASVAAQATSTDVEREMTLLRSERKRLQALLLEVKEDYDAACAALLGERSRRFAEAGERERAKLERFRKRKQRPLQPCNEDAMDGWGAGVGGVAVKGRENPGQQAKRPRESEVVEQNVDGGSLTGDTLRRIVMTWKEREWSGVMLHESSEVLRRVAAAGVPPLPLLPTVTSSLAARLQISVTASAMRPAGKTVGKERMLLRAALADYLQVPLADLSIIGEVLDSGEKVDGASAGPGGGKRTISMVFQLQCASVEKFVSAEALLQGRGSGLVEVQGAVGWEARAGLQDAIRLHYLQEWRASRGSAGRRAEKSGVPLVRHLSFVRPMAVHLEICVVGGEEFGASVEGGDWRLVGATKKREPSLDLGRAQLGTALLEWVKRRLGCGESKDRESGAVKARGRVSLSLQANVSQDRRDLSAPPQKVDWSILSEEGGGSGAEMSYTYKNGTVVSCSVVEGGARYQRDAAVRDGSRGLVVVLPPLVSAGIGGSESANGLRNTKQEVLDVLERADRDLMCILQAVKWTCANNGGCCQRLVIVAAVSDDVIEGAGGRNVVVHRLCQSAVAIGAGGDECQECVRVLLLDDDAVLEAIAFNVTQSISALESTAAAATEKFPASVSRHFVELCRVWGGHSVSVRRRKPEIEVLGKESAGEVALLQEAVAWVSGSGCMQAVVQQYTGGSLLHAIWRQATGAMPATASIESESLVEGGMSLFRQCVSRLEELTRVCVAGLSESQKWLEMEQVSACEALLLALPSVLEPFKEGQSAKVGSMVSTEVGGQGVTVRDDANDARIVLQRAQEHCLHLLGGCRSHPIRAGPEGGDQESVGVAEERVKAMARGLLPGDGEESCVAVHHCRSALIEARARVWRMLELVVEVRMQQLERTNLVLCALDPGVVEWLTSAEPGGLTYLWVTTDPLFLPIHARERSPSPMDPDAERDSQALAHATPPPNSVAFRSPSVQAGEGIYERGGSFFQGAWVGIESAEGTRDGQEETGIEGSEEDGVEQIFGEGLAASLKALEAATHAARQSAVDIEASDFSASGSKRNRSVMLLERSGGGGKRRLLPRLEFPLDEQLSHSRFISGDRKPDNVVSVEQKLEGLLDFGSGDEVGASSQGEALMRESGWLPRFDRSYRGILAKFGL